MLKEPLAVLVELLDDNNDGSSLWLLRATVHIPGMIICAIAQCRSRVTLVCDDVCLNRQTFVGSGPMHFKLLQVFERRQVRVTYIAQAGKSINTSRDHASLSVADFCLLGTSTIPFLLTKRINA